MFLKLLKYKFNAQRNLFIILNSVVLTTGVLSGALLKLFINHEEHISDIVSTLAAIFGYMLWILIRYSIMAYAIVMIILLMVQFYKSHFSDEGYLTFTLPATTHQHLLSSFVNNLIWIAITMTVTIGSIALMESPITSIYTYSIDPNSNPYAYSMIPFAIFMVVGSLLSNCILPMVAISIGCVATRKAKPLASFGIYYGIQAIVFFTLGVLCIFALAGDLFIMDYTNSNAFQMFITMLIPLIVFPGVSIGGYFLMHRLVDRKLNLP